MSVILHKSEHAEQLRLFIGQAPLTVDLEQRRGLAQLADEIDREHDWLFSQMVKARGERDHLQAAALMPRWWRIVSAVERIARAVQETSAEKRRASQSRMYERLVERAEADKNASKGDTR